MLHIHTFGVIAVTVTINWKLLSETVSTFLAYGLSILCKGASSEWSPCGDREAGGSQSMSEVYILNGDIVS